MTSTSKNLHSDGVESVGGKQPQSVLRQHLILCGMMGAGKTSVGRKLSETLDVPFADTDERIVKREGRSVPELFNEGEAFFRRCERSTILNVLNEPPSVISLGGGSLQDAEFTQQLRLAGFLVFLDTPLDVILERIGHLEGRPLLNGDASQESQDGSTALAARKAKIEQLMSARRPLYEMAHIRVEITKALSVDQIAQMIVKRIHDE